MVYAAGGKRLYRCNFLLREKNYEANGGNHGAPRKKFAGGLIFRVERNKVKPDPV